MTKTRPSTTSAVEIPVRPATGRGAPAVPSNTSSVVMLVSVRCSAVRTRSVAARPARTGDGPRLLPSSEAMPVKGPTGQPVAEGQQCSGTRREDGASGQRIGDNLVLGGRRRLGVAGSIQPDRYGRSGPCVVDGWSGRGGEKTGSFGPVRQPPCCLRLNRGRRVKRVGDGRATLGQNCHRRLEAGRGRTLGVVDVPGKQRR